MDWTNTVAKAYNTTPFEIMKQETDDVLLYLEYLLEKEDEPTEEANDIKVPKGTKAVKVNDKTATNGWW